MNFDLSDEQREIKRTARDLLADRSGPAHVRAAVEAGAYDPALWSELCELGWTGIAVEERHGGLGVGTVAAAVLLEEAGAALTGAPLLGTLSAGFAIAAAGSELQQAEWLPRLASGDAAGAVGVVEGTVAELVPDADGADVIVLLASDGARLVSREDADVTPVETLDPTRRHARVAAEGEPLPGDAGHAWAHAAVAVAAEVVGVCQRALDMTVSYAKERRQFDAPIGSFQAVAHRCADMLLATESARSAAYFGAWAADASPAELPRAAALAKAVAATAGRDVTASAIQAHGGIGFTWEADVHWYYKRAQVDAQLLGGAGEQLLALAGYMRRRAA